MADIFRLPEYLGNETGKIVWGFQSKKKVPSNFEQTGSFPCLSAGGVVCQKGVLAFIFRVNKFTKELDSISILIPS